MSLYGVEPDIVKFQPVADALKANKTDVAKALIANLSDAEKIRVKQFIIEDKQKFLKEQREREARKAQLESEIADSEMKLDKLGTDIVNLDIKQAVIFSDGSKKAAASLAARPLPVPGQQKPAAAAVLKL